MADNVEQVKTGDTTDGLKSILSQVQALKTGERSEEQRKIAILATKIEDCVAWATYTFES